MANTIAQKLRIKEKETLLTVNAQIDFKKGLTGLPAGVKIVTTGKDYNQVHWFVLNKAQLEKQMSKVMKLVKPEIIVWVYYPKGTSKIQTDLTRDKGWDCLMAESDKLKWINLISFNNTWSVFGFRAKTNADKKKEAKPVEREIFNWVNSTTKEVRLPDELTVALKNNKKLSNYFHSLAFSHKKEYIEWIVTAKKEETKMKRVEGTMERLEKKWKNPMNN
ncbi:MAG: YdeI/OmpD-associated family protein [Chitinophagaceae bacterium]